MTDSPPVPSPTLHARLDFYDSALLYTRFEGSATTTYPVAPQDLVQRLAQLPSLSGLLPEGTLAWGHQNGQVALCIYVPARRWHVQTSTRIYHLPLPPLVFTGCARHYHIFAVQARPQPGQPTPLFRCPTPNVGPDGSICRGNTAFPVCAPETIWPALTLFCEGSLFNTHLTRDASRRFPENVLDLWDTLDGKRRFPRRDLVPTPLALEQLLPRLLS